LLRDIDLVPRRCRCCCHSLLLGRLEGLHLLLLLKQLCRCLRLVSYLSVDARKNPTCA
jgi:hypothetical protein